MNLELSWLRQTAPNIYTTKQSFLMTVIILKTQLSTRMWGLKGSIVVMDGSGNCINPRFILVIDAHILAVIMEN